MHRLEFSKKRHLAARTTKAHYENLAKKDCALRLESIPTIGELANGFSNLKRKMDALYRVTGTNPEIKRLTDEI